MDDATPVESKSPPLAQAELDILTDKLIEKLKSVYDPEIPVDIYELGLIYKVDVSDDKDVAIDMTLTAPGCPVAGEMPGFSDRTLPSASAHSIPLACGVCASLGSHSDIDGRTWNVRGGGGSAGISSPNSRSANVARRDLRLSTPWV